MFSGGKIGSGFFPPVYYTFFETKLVANSIKLQVRKAKKKRTALKKGKKKNYSFLFSVEMLISLYITRTLNYIFMDAGGKSVYFSCVLKRIIYLPRKKQKVHMQISFSNKNILLKFTFGNKVNVVACS